MSSPGSKYFVLFIRQCSDAMCTSVKIEGTFGGEAANLDIFWHVQIPYFGLSTQKCSEQ